MSIQFGRYIEVEIKDYNSKTKTIVGNEFEIEFDYFKTIDQTKQDDSGVIRIFGLTPATIKTLQSEGGEVILRCGYEKSKISTLFIASIVRLYYQTSDNTTVTTIECSANLLNYYHVGGISSIGGRKTIYELAESLSNVLGASDFVIDLSGLPVLASSEALISSVEEFLLTFEPNVTIFSDKDSLVSEFCRIFGFEYFRDELGDGSFKSVFSLTPDGALGILRDIKNGYPSRSKPNAASANKNAIFMSTLSSDSKSRVATVLDSETGLIESKTEYKITKAYAGESLSGNEEETSDSESRRAARETKYWEKERKKEQQALKKGKVYKRKEFYEEEYIQINRRYLRVKALINPDVKPQGIVAVAVKTDEVLPEGSEDGFTPSGVAIICRVRSAQYKGNNKRDSWTMDLYCEDTDTTQVTQDEINSFASKNSEEEFQIEEDL